MARTRLPEADSQAIADLEITVEVDVLDLGVVEDRKTGEQIGHRGGVQVGVALRCAVVTGEGVRIAEEERIPLGERALHVEMAAQVDADLEALVLETIECCRDQAVALSVAIVLTLEMAELADLRVHPETLGERRRVVAESDPQLVDIDLLVTGGRIAVVEVDEIDLGVRLDARPPGRGGQQSQDGELEVLPLVHRLEEDRRRPRRQEVPEVEGTANAEALAVAIVSLALEAEVHLESVRIFCRRGRIRRRVGSDRRFGRLLGSC